jgi:hydroxyethylthiazole kinase
MKKIKIEAAALLEKIRAEKPVVHHLTNWVTIYDCAQIIKVMGGSPVMAHAKEEAAEMAKIASSLVLNIGTLTVDFVEAMKIAAKSANEKGIPVILDVCGAGATRLRDEKCMELLHEVKIDIIKGNASEIARINGEEIRTKGVDSAHVSADLKEIARELAQIRKATVVVTGEMDIVSNGTDTYLVKNGTPMLTHVVGSGCMVTSVIGAFAAVEKDLAKAAASGLVCFELAAECAVKKARGPGSFKEGIFDCLANLDKKTIDSKQKVERL